MLTLSCRRARMELNERGIVLACQSTFHVAAAAERQLHAGLSIHAACAFA